MKNKQWSPSKHGDKYTKKVRWSCLMNWCEWGVHSFYIVFKNDIDVSSLNTLPSPSTYCIHQASGFLLQWTGICEIQLFGRRILIYLFLLSCTHYYLAFERADYKNSNSGIQETALDAVPITHISTVYY